MIDVAMPEAGVKPDVVTYSTLINMLRIEGDDDAAKKVFEEMKKAKVQPDEKTKEILNYPARGKNLSRMRTAKLASLLKQGGDEATTAARSMMDKMVKNGVADAHLFNLMLKLCTSSDEIRKVIDVAMPEAGVKPNVVTYNTLINMLRIEGDDDAAKKVVEEMKKAKVQPDEKTKEILNYPARGKDLSKQRTAKLASLLKQGGDEATTAARSMMDKMVKNGVADAHLFSLMLKLCTSSDEIRKVIDVAMPEAGVKPDVVTYNTLISMLRIEGDDEAAKKVVEEMKKAKVGPNEKTKEMLNYPARGEVLSRMRTAKLASLLKQGGDEATTAARSMMDKMVENGVARILLLLTAPASS